MLGGIQSSESISPIIRAYVTERIAEVNEALEAHNTSYEIVSESTQLVDGVNHYVHLMGNHDGHKYSLTIH
jgi:hypothetical protein